MPKLTDLISELQRRQEEGISLYRPTEEQLPYHLSWAQQKLLRGGNRSGKTTGTAAEVSSAATGIPLRDCNGSPIEHQYPVDRPLLIWIIGIDKNHLARIYRKLTGPGIFRVIPDKKTGKLRSWRPWNKADYVRRSETKPSPPFIPERMIERTVWLEGGKRIPAILRLKNGTTIYFFPSGGVPGMGDPVDLIYIDEDIKFPQYVPEWIARLPDGGKGVTPSGKWVEGGRLLWSAWPWDNNDALQTMTRLASEEAGKADPVCHETILWFSKNKFISARLKARTIRAWSVFGPAVVAARDRGEYLTDSVRWFPNFAVEIHGVPRRVGPDALELALAENGGQVLPSWTHYFSIDPGHTHNVGVFVSIPPPSVGDWFYVWREIYLEGGSADFMAQEIKRLSWPLKFEAFFLDDHAGRQSYQGMGGYKIRDHYSDAFEKIGLVSRTTGTRFLSGSDDITARNLLLKSWLDPREDGTTKFRINAIYCPETIKEFSLYKKKITRDDVTDKEVPKWNHAMAAITYLASRHPQWIPPEVYQTEVMHPMDALLDHMPYFKTNKSGAPEVYFGAGAIRSNAV